MSDVKNAQPGSVWRSRKDDSIWVRRYSDSLRSQWLKTTVIEQDSFWQTVVQPLSQAEEADLEPLAPKRNLDPTNPGDLREVAEFLDYGSFSGNSETLREHATRLELLAEEKALAAETQAKADREAAKKIYEGFYNRGVSMVVAIAEGIRLGRENAEASE